jgi:acyl-CoA synthetase (AMP-forming)/AMP-acid ligase II/acyl carrier protein
MVQLTPSRLRLLLNLKGNLPGMAGVKELMVGGEAFPAQLAARAKEHFRGKIFNMYGPTETTIWSMVKELTHTTPGQITIGTPIANTRIYIVNEGLGLQPVGAAGELLIGGEGVAIGYLNNIELTAEKFIRAVISKKSLVNSHWSLVNNKSPKITNHRFSKFTNDQCPMTNDRFYKTGDLARWLDNGEIEFLGRLDHQVKVRGFRVELEEIEEQLVKHESIKEAVVVLKVNPGGDQSLCAYVVPVSPTLLTSINAAELRQMLLVQLPHYMIPSFIVPMEKMPLTPNGKINRKALPEPELSRTGLGTDATYVEPGSDNEKAIAQIWKDILHLEDIGIHDNFFDLGGNSMNVIQLSWKLKEILGIDIPVARMFRNLTIDFLSKNLGQKEAKAEKEFKQKRVLEKARETFMETISMLVEE